MNDWFRSLSLLGAAFVGVVLLTIGLSLLIVPKPAASDSGIAAPTTGASGASPPSAGPAEIGGTLVVSGARAALFTLDREELGSRYAITGPDGRVIFEGSPLTVAQISFDGLEFFLDPGECSVTPGERHDETGVAGAHIMCEEIADVRDQGVVSIDGVIGVAADLLGLRGDLPESGGAVRLGDETLTFDVAAMTIPSGSRFSGVFAGSLHDPETATTITFTYDPLAHEMVLSEIAHAAGQPGQPNRVPPEACSVNTTEIGPLNPHTRVAEMSIRCPSLDIPELGTVPLEGTLIVELSEPPN